ILRSNRSNPNAEVLLAARCCWRRKLKKRTTREIFNVRIIAVVISPVATQILIQTSEVVAMSAKVYIADKQRPIVIAVTGDINRESEMQSSGDGIRLRDDHHLPAGVDTRTHQVTWLHECRITCRQRVHQGRKLFLIVDAGSNQHVRALVITFVEP